MLLQEILLKILGHLVKLSRLFAFYNPLCTHTTQVAPSQEMVFQNQFLFLYLSIELPVNVSVQITATRSHSLPNTIKQLNFYEEILVLPLGTLKKADLVLLGDINRYQVGNNSWEITISFTRLKKPWN